MHSDAFELDANIANFVYYRKTRSAKRHSSFWAINAKLTSVVNGGIKGFLSSKK